MSESKSITSVPPNWPPNSELRLWKPDASPKEDYPLTAPRHPPASCQGGPVTYPPPSQVPETDFQDFVWDIVTALERINSGLFSYKKAISMGSSHGDAKKLYDLAVQNYLSLYIKWKAELDDVETWVRATVTFDGYITDVLVQSRRFAIHTPGQSESHSSTNPPRQGP